MVAWATSVFYRSIGCMPNGARDISSRAPISGWAKPKRATIALCQTVSIVLRSFPPSLLFQLSVSRAVRLSSRLSRNRLKPFGVCRACPAA